MQRTEKKIQRWFRIDAKVYMMSEEASSLACQESFAVDPKTSWYFSLARLFASGSSTI